MRPPSRVVCVWGIPLNIDPFICKTYLTMASGDNVCFSSLLTAWRRPCALEFMSERRAASSPLDGSKLPVNCVGGEGNVSL